MMGCFSLAHMELIKLCTPPFGRMVTQLFDRFDSIQFYQVYMTTNIRPVVHQFSSTSDNDD